MNDVSFEFSNGETLVTELGGDLDLSILIDRLAFTGGGNSPDLAILIALMQEIQEARAGRSTLHKRISTISNFASPNGGGYIKGQYTDNAFHGTNPATLLGVAGHCTMAPFFTSMPLTVDEMGVAVTTAVAGATGRCFLYAAGDDGWPSDLVYEPEGNLDLSTTGFKAHVLNPPLVIEPGRSYWIGFRSFSTATIRAVNVGSVPNLGPNGSNGANYFTALRRTIPEATRLPAQWGFSMWDRVGNVAPPSVRMRIA